MLAAPAHATACASPGRTRSRLNLRGRLSGVRTLAYRRDLFRWRVCEPRLRYWSPRANCSRPPGSRFLSARHEPCWSKRLGFLLGGTALLEPRSSTVDTPRHCSSEWLPSPRHRPRSFRTAEPSRSRAMRPIMIVRGRVPRATARTRASRAERFAIARCSTSVCRRASSRTVAADVSSDGPLDLRLDPSRGGAGGRELEHTASRSSGCCASTRSCEGPPPGAPLLRKARSGSSPDPCATRWVDRALGAGLTRGGYSQVPGARIWSTTSRGSEAALQWLPDAMRPGGVCSPSLSLGRDRRIAAVRRRTTGTPAHSERISAPRGAGPTREWWSPRRRDRTQSARS